MEINSNLFSRSFIVTLGPLTFIRLYKKSGGPGLRKWLRGYFESIEQNKPRGWFPKESGSPKPQDNSFSEGFPFMSGGLGVGLCLCVCVCFFLGGACFFLFG